MLTTPFEPSSLSGSLIWVAAICCDTLIRRRTSTRRACQNPRCHSLTQQCQNLSVHGHKMYIFIP
ncbi:unnamed protein product [Penicillium nalgiovense]|uniref:Uncharacterized protein n=1 Tax=Penicillium nalgiovense TaxID=60175 RepID=A0A9W4HRV1_PENNA|nr:unnamed protein product [Penicillium nalgiovense]CAG8100428.1 unnamed protein product [Penicillium nalgiovense]CAG8123618.1 unnamed protein product [Penicillium nalgiovense]CAG8238076.1 unnamed protein product [Penicillium nalgiovense]CAG8243334.1 unnamed protein product [Penicillium nalgiovense]